MAPSRPASRPRGASPSPALSLSVSSTTVAGNFTVTNSATSTLSGDFAFDTDTLYVDSLNNRVGIGTTSPSDTLAINGAAYLAPISIPSVTTDRIYNIGSNLYFAGALVGGATVGTWALSGSDAYRLSGNVGIGTTTPGSILSVSGVGNLGANGSTFYSTLTVSSITATSSLILTGTGANMLLSTNAGGVIVSSSTPTVAAIYATSTTATSTFAGNISLSGNINTIRVGQLHQVYGIGDSISYNTYQTALEGLLGEDTWNVNNKAVGGNTTTLMLARFNLDVLVPDNEYVIIVGGINDVLAGASETAIENNLQAMYTAAQNYGVKVVAVTITPFKGYATWSSSFQTIVDNVNTWILNSAVNVDYKVNAYASLEDPTNPDALLASYDNGDHLHLSASGGTALATTIHNSVIWTPRSLFHKLTLSGSDVALSQNLRPSDSPQFSGLTVNSNVCSSACGMKFYLNTAGPTLGIGTVAPAALFEINATSSTAIAQIIKGATSQSVDLVQIQDSLGRVWGGYKNGGALFFGQNGASAPIVYPFSGTSYSTPGVYAKGLGFFSYVSADVNAYAFAFSSGSVIPTSGTIDLLYSTTQFSPTSGSAVFNNLHLNPLVNQTGGASGITRGLIIDPLLTSAANWRSLEITNNTGYGIYESGSASNYFAGKIGIGTTTPAAKLSVSNSAGATAAAFLVSTSTADFSTSTAFIIDSNGKVGIGTTTPGTDLSVQGVASAQSFQAYGTTATSTLAGGLLANGSALSNLYVSPTTGNVGVRTSNPLSALQIVSGTDGKAWQVRDSDNVLRAHLVTEGTGGTGVNGFGLFGGTYLAFQNSESNLYPQAILKQYTDYFHVYATGNAAENKLYLYSDGEMWLWPSKNGAGTAAVYMVNGQLSPFTDKRAGVTLGSASRRWLNFYSSLITDNAIGVGIATSSPWAVLSVAASSTNPGNIPLFAVSTSTASATSTAFLIDSTGKVGIGTTSPWRTLSVQGTVAFSGITATGAGDTYLCLSGGGEVKTGASCAGSSLRFKHDVIGYTGGLGEVNALRPVTFEFNGIEGVRLGLIAEEVHVVDPRLVFYDEDGITPRGVRYQDIGPVLISSIQGLSSILNIASSTTATSTGFSSVRLDSLESRISALEEKSLTGSLGASVGDWVGNSISAISGYIKNLTAETVKANDSVSAGKTLCVQKSDGFNVCVTGDQLSALLENANLLSSGGEASSSPITGTTTPSAGESTSPTITLLGNNPATITVGTVFVDPGATAVDASANQVLPDIATSTVDTTTPGTYSVIWTAHDANMVWATSTRTVIVIDSFSAPVPTTTPTQSETDPAVQAQTVDVETATTTATTTLPATQ